MKTKIITENGFGKEIDLPSCFSSNVRQDIAQKCYEIEKKYQPFGIYKWAGMDVSASGIIRHARKVWKTAYGHGISRIPRKIMWRRGNQFYWKGAVVTGTVGGRRAHPPQVEHFESKLKINKNEKKIAMASGISSTTRLDCLKKRYQSLKDNKTNIVLPIIIDSSLLKLKTKKFFEILKKAVNDFYDVTLQESRKRAGMGKDSNKKSAGLLLVIAKEEDYKINGIEVKKVNELGMKDFYPLGRLAAYTEKAVHELGAKYDI